MSLFLCAGHNHNKADWPTDAAVGLGGRFEKSTTVPYEIIASLTTRVLRPEQMNDHQFLGFIIG